MAPDLRLANGLNSPTHSRPALALRALNALWLGIRIGVGILGAIDAVHAAELLVGGMVTAASAASRSAGPVAAVPDKSFGVLLAHFIRVNGAMAVLVVVRPEVPVRVDVQITYL